MDAALNVPLLDEKRLLEHTENMKNLKAPGASCPSNGPSTGLSTCAGSSDVPDLLSLAGSDSDWGAIIDQNYDSSPSNLFDPKPTVHHRFPGMTGKVLWNVLKKHYLLAIGNFPLIAKDFLDEHGEFLPLLTRSDLNDRNENDTRAKYKVSIRKFGLQWEGRSKCVVIRVNPCKHTGQRRLLAAAHCVEALWECFAEDRAAKKT